MSIIQPNTSYNIVENTISQNAIQFPDSLDNAVVDKIISIGSNGFTLKRDILTTVKETIISAIDITDVNTGNVITFDDLTYLPIGLGALTVPSNTTTCNFNDAIQVQDYDTTLAPPPSNTQAKLSANPSTFLGIQFTSTETIQTTISNDNANTLAINSAGNLELDALGSLDLESENSITLTSNLLYNVNLDAPNVNSYNYAMPICFTSSINSGFSYTNTGQIFDMVFQSQFAIPQQFVSISPLPAPFTSSNWKIQFDLNCYQFSNPTDKGIGIYIDFIDAASTVYTPITYNANTPFTENTKNFGYNNNGNQPFYHFNWADVVDLSPLINTGTSNFPFDMRIWFAADNPISTNFNLLLTLTRTNLI
jgi:hypothetical protein